MTTRTTPAQPAHTSGPWTVSEPDGQGLITVGTREVEIATCYDAGNARLIANAPELLAAARIGLACCIAWGGKCEAQGESILALQAAMHAESIRTTIANATA